MAAATPERGSGGHRHSGHRHFLYVLLAALPVLLGAAGIAAAEDPIAATEQCPITGTAAPVVDPVAPATATSDAKHGSGLLARLFYLLMDKEFVRACYMLAASVTSAAAVLAGVAVLAAAAGVARGGARWSATTPRRRSHWWHRCCLLRLGPQLQLVGRGLGCGFIMCGVRRS